MAAAGRSNPASRHWAADDPFATAFFNSLSVGFARAASFFCESLSAGADELPDELQKDIRSFVRHKICHCREHIAFNRMVRDRGHNFASLEEVVDRVLDAIEQRSEIDRLEATMCFTHLVTVFAAEILRETDHLKDVDLEARKFWLRHAIDEIEHKNVAYEVWLYAMRDRSAMYRWWSRSSMMLALSAGFVKNRTLGQIELLRQDGYSAPEALSGALRYAFRRGGIGRNMLLPWAGFFKPGFHPARGEDPHLVAIAEQRLEEAAPAPAAQ